MNKNILNSINLILFIISFIYILKIIVDNSDDLKNTIININNLYVFPLILLAYINNFFGNSLTYILVKPFANLKLNKFTEINLTSNLINQAIPFFGTLYKGYVLKKFNFSYLNYINVLILIRFLQIYLVFFLCLLFVFLFEERFIFKAILLIAILSQFFLLFFFKSIRIKNNFFQNKYIKNIKIFIGSFALRKKKIFLNVIIMRITDFSIFFILVNNIISVDIKTILTMYALRFFIHHLPLIGNTLTTIVVSTFTFTILDMGFLESFSINLLQSLIIIFGTIMCLFTNFIYNIFKR